LGGYEKFRIGEADAICRPLYQGMILNAISNNYNINKNGLPLPSLPISPYFFHGIIGYNLMYIGISSPELEK
jgi:hypothetical protein